MSSLSPLPLLLPFEQTTMTRNESWDRVVRPQRIYRTHPSNLGKRTHLPAAFKFGQPSSPHHDVIGLKFVIRRMQPPNPKPTLAYYRGKVSSLRLPKSHLIAYSTLCWLSWVNTLHICNTGVVNGAGRAQIPEWVGPVPRPAPWGQVCPHVKFSVFMS
ncbi:hypothetical protein ILYODFUR_033428 [Ilyodon furcidens]|uniref:Uncharacterized protein n=1 Tax=Ilyodon furcidens TaxID=33524 RepID=A0ABV0UEP6_9TELE